MDFHVDAKALKNEHRMPSITQEVWHADEGIVFPLKEAYDRANGTLEGVESTTSEDHGPLSLPPVGEPEEAAATSLHDEYVHVNHTWMRIHRQPRTRLFNPRGVDGGPNVANLEASRLTLL